MQATSVKVLAVALRCFLAPDTFQYTTCQRKVLAHDILPGMTQIGMMEIQHAQGRSMGLQPDALPILRHGHRALLTPLTLPSTALMGVRLALLSTNNHSSARDS